MCICNIGHVTGVTHGELIDLFSHFGDIEDVALVPHKSFSFITFANPDSALQAYSKLNGETGDKLGKSVKIYLAFVESIPNQLVKSCKNWPRLFQDLPEGLKVVKNFVSAKEEVDILQRLNWHEADTEVLKNRQVCHFGKEFIYGSNTIAESADEKTIEPFPASWTPMIQRSIGWKLSLTQKGLQTSR